MATDVFQHNLISMQNTLLNFAMMLTGNRDNAYDLVQDTTLRALDNRDKFAEGTNLKGWLYTIMRNIFINNYRRMAYEATIIDTSDNLYHLNLSQDSGIEAPADSIESEEIANAIKHLPQELRQPFALFVTGYKYIEIAECLHMPIGTVKTHIFKARKRLQTELSDYA